MSAMSGSRGEYEANAFAGVVTGFSAGAGRDHRDRGIGREEDPGERSGGEHPTRADREESRSGTGTNAEEQLVSAEAIPLQPVEETAFVRPYALTGGRTKANYQLELETLVSTREAARLSVPEQFEHQQIMEECRTPHSVAEIAATLRVPLGVARVLISDVADAGLVTVHRTTSGDEGAEAHLMLMERVLSGLRRL